MNKKIKEEMKREEERWGYLEKPAYARYKDEAIANLKQTKEKEWRDLGERLGIIKKVG